MLKYLLFLANKFMNISFTDVQKDLLIGTLLGDGNLQTTNGQFWRYRAIQKAFSKPYIEHKYHILQDICNSPPIYSEVYDERTKKTYQRYSFSTLTNDQLRFYGNLFYANVNGQWVKKVPKDIENYLTPRALAYWYMDDGALKWEGHSNSVRFCTDSFQLPEIQLLKNALENKFGLKCSLQKKNNICRIATSESSYPKLKELIVPHLLPCMYYKFPDGNNGVLQNEDVSNDIRNTFTERNL